MRNSARYGEGISTSRDSELPIRVAENERRVAAKTNDTDQQAPRIRTRSRQLVKHHGDRGAVSGRNFFALAAFIQ
jgi:hypothetical protein